jgi:hypothetical protein
MCGVTALQGMPTCHISERDAGRVGVAALCAARAVPAVHQALRQEQQRDERDPQCQHRQQHLLQLLLERGTHYAILHACSRTHSEAASWS